MPLLGRKPINTMKNVIKNPKKENTKKPNIDQCWELINPDAAGLDIGAREHWACVPPNRVEKNVRNFGTFTTDLEALADWFQECGVKTVAMEATGVYWIALLYAVSGRVGGGTQHAMPASPESPATDERVFAPCLERCNGCQRIGHYRGDFGRAARSCEAGGHGAPASARQPGNDPKGADGGLPS